MLREHAITMITIFLYSAGKNASASRTGTTQVRYAVEIVRIEERPRCQLCKRDGTHPLLAFRRLCF